MSFFCNSDELLNESDVEQKLIYPLLSSKEGLGYYAEEIRTKEYLSPAEIDKGAGKKIGYYPDYAIMLSSLFAIVVEAKSPNQSVDAGFREAQLYAHEINKRFESNINPVSIVIACNGSELVYGEWDIDAPKRIPVAELVPGLSDFEKLRIRCRRESLVPNIAVIRQHLCPSRRFKPLKLLGGPTKQNTEISPNRFAQELVPILRNYFDPDATRSSKELIEKAYVTTRDTTHYDSVLEALLKDNLARLRYPLFDKITTSKQDAPELNKAMKELVRQVKSHSNPLLLVIGGVGCGKSMFIDRYYYHLMDEDVRKNTAWVFVDFNSAPDDLSGLDTWITSAALHDFPKRNSISNFLEYKNIWRYFAPDIYQRDQGAYKILKEKQPEEYERRIADDLVRWQDDPSKLLKGVMRYFMGDKGMKVVAVFDNADRRDAEQQLRIFQAAQHFRAEYGPLCILALRDETYERFKNEPPLDAYFKPFAFRISPPRFVDVVKRRLQLVIGDLTERAPKRLSYILPNSVTVEYPATDLGKYLIGVYKSLFNPTRRVRLILEALAGLNVRNALQMFTDILISGYMRDEFIFAARYDNREEVELPEWLVLRILMRTKYRYFTDDHGYVVNLFNIDEGSPTTSNFLLPDILYLLSRDRKRQGELGIEGYRHVGSLLEDLSTRGYLSEDIMWGFKHLLRYRLVIADHQRTRDVTRDNYVKITASGHYHLNILLKRVEYLANVSIDTWFRDDVHARHIARHDQDSKKHATERIGAMKAALEREAHFYAEQCMKTETTHSGRDIVLKALSDSLAYLEYTVYPEEAFEGDALKAKKT